MSRGTWSGCFQGGVSRAHAGSRQILSTDAVRPGAGPEVIAAAFAEIDFSDLTVAA